jgi:hypothetical protein
MKRRIIAFFSILGFISAGLVGITATPALAVPGCPAQTICYFDTANGPLLSQHSGGVPRNECRGVDPATSAFRNNTTTRWFVFGSASCVGAHKEIHPGDANTVAAAFGPGWDNGLHSQYRTSLTTFTYTVIQLG